MPMAVQRGGGELMLTQLLEHGRRADIQWVVVFFEDGPLVSHVKNLGVETSVVDTGRLREVHRFIRSVAAIGQRLRTCGANIVFSWSAKPHLYGSLAALMAGIPSVWYQLGYPKGIHLSLLDRVSTAMPARGVVTLSKGGAAAQEQLWPHRPTRLVYPGVELDRFDPDRLPPPGEARERLGLPGTGPLIGMVGRLQRWKGMHVLLEAMPSILKEEPAAHCVIVGGRHQLEANYEAFLHERIDALELEAHVTMAGFQQNIPEWMQAMDVVVHASEDEPFGIVILEGMALGKPVVAGNTVGPSEIIRNGHDGLLAPYGDPDALAEKILDYITDPEFMRVVGTAARARAAQFSPQQYANNVIEALQHFVLDGDVIRQKRTVRA